jgi:hypothetical protein
VSIISGILFGVMDGIINANPVAQKLYLVYQPISKKSLNFVAGIAIDLVYGLVMAAVFLLLYKALPGDSGLIKGIIFALLVWFFRVVMQAGSQWLMYTVPVKALLYSLVAGLVEMLVLGIFYGLFL